MSERSGRLSPELSAIADFVSHSLPFNELGETELHRVIAEMVIQYHRQGETLDKHSEPTGLRILRSGAVDIRDSDNKLLDRLGEGESFHIQGLNAERGEVQATVIEDALCYLLPDEHYQSLRSGNRSFDRYFSAQRNRRLRRAARYQTEASVMMREVRSLMSTQLLTVGEGDTAQQVAASMSARRVSSALVMDGAGLAGIVTDRDLRERYVAVALGPDTPVVDVMTAAPLTIEGGESLFGATLLMTQRGIHHLPVTEQGELAGVITTSDLVLARQDDPVYLVQRIARQDDIEGIKDLLGGMPNLLVQWVQTGIRAHEISRILTAICDAVTRRLIQLAERALGEAPVPWCWLCFGSQARGEQLLGADQDNGIVISDKYLPEHRPWFAALAERVCDGLRECGYAHCSGKVMATTEQWCQPLAAWQETIDRWARSPTPDAVMRVSIFFDSRAVYGDVDLCGALQQTMLETAGRNTIFQAALAANVLENRPPLGIFRRFVVDRNGEHAAELDLKKRGILPLTDIVRLHALANGIDVVNSTERIEALAAAGALTLVDSRNLADALHCMQQQRVRHQRDQVIAGQELSNFLNPRGLPKMAREQLRDAFTIIDEAQSGVRQRYRAGLE